MKTLIVRTDRLGDFYETLPYINSIKRKYGKENVDILVSEGIYKHFKRKKYLYKNIFSFSRKSLFKKINLIIQLRKINYQNIVIFDGKDRSIILSFFLKSSKKFIILEEKKLNLFLKFFLSSKKYEVLLNNGIDSYHKLFTNLLKLLNVVIYSDDYKFLEYKKLNNLNLVGEFINYFENYTLIHIDEKWFSNLYIIDYYNIDPDINNFLNFIKNFCTDFKQNLIITTGLIENSLINDIKKIFNKKNDHLFTYESSNQKVILVTDTSVEDLEVIAMNSKNIITCHGPLSHIAGSFNINLIDIIENKHENWYQRHIFNTKSYNKLFRKKFNELSKEMLTKLRK